MSQYSPSPVPQDPKDLPAWLAREVQSIAVAISDRSPKLDYGVGLLVPAQLTGNTDNYKPQGLEGARWVRLSSSIPINITGVKNPEAGVPRWLWFTNVGTQTITFVHASGSSDADARFSLPGAANVALTQNSGLILGYDPVVSLWRALAHSL